MIVKDSILEELEKKPCGGYRIHIKEFDKLNWKHYLFDYDTVKVRDWLTINEIFFRKLLRCVK